MAAYKCKMCGGDLLIEAGMSVCECEYCGTKQTVPNADNEKKMTLFARAGRLLRGCEFDKAAGVFETIVGDYPEEAEAYWGLVLCHYGIEYVDDPATGKKVPTCHRSSFDGVMKNENFEQACENADAIARRIYRDEARAIEELRKGIIEVSGKEDPYDIFISYKETDDNGNRTLDSVIAQDIYDALTEKGYRVFFSRITLEDKLGTEYEPYIFAALNSAKIMLVVGTDYEHFDAVWVKNEWSRFLKLIAAGQKKTLIPCYKNMDAYDMPEEFAKLTAQDMGKIGAMQDLLRGVGKLLPKEQPKVEVVRETVVKSANSTVDTLLERMFMFLEDGKWNDAEVYAEKVLDAEPKNAEAYVGKLMSNLRVRVRTALKDYAEPIADYGNYKKAVRFGNSALIAELEGYNAFIVTRNKNVIYDAAQSMMDAAATEEAYKKAAQKFGEIPAWRDADAKVKESLELAENARKDAIYEAANSMMDNAADEEEFRDAAVKYGEIPGWRDADEKAAECLRVAEIERKNKKYDEACELQQKDTIEALQKAIETFKGVYDWKDSAVRSKQCDQRIAELKAQAEAERIAAEKKAEEERIAAEEKAKKIKKTITIATVLAVLIAIAAAVILLIVIPNNKYNDAVAMMELGEYTEAKEILTELNSKKSMDAVYECNYFLGLQLMDEKKYVTAIQLLEEANGYADATTAIQESKYRFANQKFDAEQYCDALVIFEEIVSYKDSANYVAYIHALDGSVYSCIAKLNSLPSDFHDVQDRLQFLKALAEVEGKYDSKPVKNFRGAYYFIVKNAEIIIDMVNGDANIKFTLSERMQREADSLGYMGDDDYSEKATLTYRQFKKSGNVVFSTEVKENVYNYKWETRKMEYEKEILKFRIESDYEYPSHEYKLKKVK